jgi:molybdopterin synthase catalytic subunit
MPVRVQEAAFDIGAEIDALRAGDPRIGAVASFVGTVRDVNDGASVAAMTLEHYPGMTERALAAIVDEAKARFDIVDALVVHRVGRLAPGDAIVLVAVTGAHRGDAFAACEFVMDYLKTRAPFWKKEATAQGERWVEARASDAAAAERWRPGDAPPGSRGGARCARATARIAAGRWPDHLTACGSAPYSVGLRAAHARAVHAPPMPIRCRAARP